MFSSITTRKSINMNNTIGFDGWSGLSNFFYIFAKVRQNMKNDPIAQW